MPPSSNPNPRRNKPQSGGAPRAGAQRSNGAKGRSEASFEDRTFDIREPRRASSAKAAKPASKAPTDAGVRRREQKKKRGRQNTMLAWTVAAAVTVVLVGMGAGVMSELRSADGRVAQKRATLADLKAQFEIGKKRLHALSSASGKERVLVENGFVKPGERLLLFPKSKTKDSH